MIGLLVFAMPMMGAKGGKGANSKFDTFLLRKGTYNITKTVNTVPTEFNYEGKVSFNNETNVTSADFEKVKYVSTTVENTTTVDRQLLSVRNIIIETDNNTHVRIIKEGEIMIDAILEFDNTTTTYIGQSGIYRIVVNNAQYLQIDYFVDGTAYHFDITRTVEVVPQAWYMKLMQPGMLVLNMFITMKMKGKQTKQALPAAGANPAEEQQPEDNDGTEAEEKPAEESVAKKSKKAKKVE